MRYLPEIFLIHSWDIGSLVLLCLAELTYLLLSFCVLVLTSKPLIFLPFCFLRVCFQDLLVLFIHNMLRKALWTYRICFFKQ